MYKLIFMKITFLKNYAKYFFIGLSVSALLIVFSCNKDDTAPEEKTIEAVNLEGLTEAQQVLALVNQERTNRGLNRLKLDNELNIAAFKHSQDMDKNNYFDHIGKDGSSFGERIRRTKYAGSPRGENIARGNNNAKAVHQGWMNSKGHKANILTPGITDMGIGRSGNLWTQVFGVTR